MQDAFGIVVVGALVAGVVAAILAAWLSRNPYARIGQGGVDPPGAAPLPGEREAEIRQMLGARNARRERAGKPPVDVEAEVRRLLTPDGPEADATHDPELVAEVRALVVARNARRERAGKPPLDVEAEVARTLRDLT